MAGAGCSVFRLCAPDFVAGIKAQRLQRRQQLLLKIFVARFGHDTDTGFGVDGTDDIIWRQTGGREEGWEDEGKV